MLSEEEIKARKPVWVALSDFYLDTELGESELAYIAGVIKGSPYDIEQAKLIDFNELYPALKFNLFDIAGAWAGFDRDWLFLKVQTYLQNEPNKQLTDEDKKQWISFNAAYWQKVEGFYNQLS